MRRFEGKVALVTGGARGIGLSIVQRLASEGATVHAFDLAAPADAVPGVTWHAVDLGNAEALKATLAKLNPAPLLLVNNAGITRDKSLLKLSDDDWEAVLNVNLTAAFRIIRAVAPAMVEKGYGRIVNVASINGLRGKFGQANYTASKGGLIALTKTAARELGKKGVTVNAVAPGMVLTELTMKLDEKFRQKALDEAVLAQLPGVEDIAEAVLFLLSDAARAITGEVLKVDAGQYI